MKGNEPVEDARLWRLKDLGVEAFRKSSASDFPKHSHDEWQISWGVDRWWHRGGFHDASSGQVVIIPPGEVHATDRPDRPDRTMRSFYVHAAALRRLVEEEGFGDPEPAAPTPVIEDPGLVSRFAALWGVATGSATPLERSEAFGGLVEALATRGVTARFAGKEPRAVARAREYLQAYHSEEITLADLAEISELSPWRLNRAFRKAVGVPPHAYQVQLRVRKVKALLAGGASISEAVGLAGSPTRATSAATSRGSWRCPPANIAGQPWWSEPSGSLVPPLAITAWPLCRHPVDASTRTSQLPPLSPTATSGGPLATPHKRGWSAVPMLCHRLKPADDLSG